MVPATSCASSPTNILCPLYDGSLDGKPDPNLCQRMGKNQGATVGG